jgi:hypothetical protein
LTAECECKYPRIIPARSSLKLIIGNVKGKDVFNDQLVGRFAHRFPLLENSDQQVIPQSSKFRVQVSLLHWSYFDLSRTR